jgi:hypothetical protein
VESPPEAYLERQPSNPLSSAPLSDSPRRTMELLLLPLLDAGQENYQQVYMRRRLCYQQKFGVSLRVKL